MQLMPGKKADGRTVVCSLWMPCLPPDMTMITLQQLTVGLLTQGLTTKVVCRVVETFYVGCV